MAPADGRGRLRFAGYMIVIALVPVAIAAWALGDQARTNQVQNADVQLQPELRQAAAALAAVVAAARREAEDLAASPGLVQALVQGDREAIVRLFAPHPNMTLLRGTAILVGPDRRAGVLDVVSVLSGARTLASIVPSVSLDGNLIERLRTGGRLEPRDELVIDTRARAIGPMQGAHGPDWENFDRPRDVTVGRAGYRAVAARALGDPETSLVVLRPDKVIDAAITRAQRWIYLGAATVLALVALLAYLFAPAIARGRLVQQQRAQAARVLSEVGDGVFLLDRDGRIRLWNPAAESIMGVPAEQALGRTIDDVLPGWQTLEPLIPGGSQRGARDGSPANAVPVELGGRELWLSFSGADFAEGRVYTFRDLSEEHRVEELKMDFVATVSHELRTPLAAISGAALTLRQRADALSDETRLQLLAVISEHSERLAALIDDILMAGRLAYGRLAVSDETFDLAELGRRVVEELKAGALLDGREVDVRIPPGLPRIEGDPVKARQVLVNLLENAAKYSPGGGAITLTVEPRERFVRFSVRDEGLGIAKRDQERIFDKFYRVDPLMRQGVSGTGLGLYICRELVQHMGGRISVASAPGEGSTFTVELPLAEADVVAAGLTPGPARRRLPSRG